MKADLQSVSKAEKQSPQVCGMLQRTAIDESPVSEVPPIVYEVLRSSGQPLDVETRAFFEPRFGHDFSEVRVHTDAQAAESVDAVNALAYTVGREIVFGANQSTSGVYPYLRLLAHELTHVVQQTNIASVGSGLRIENSCLAEQEADRNSDQVFFGSPTGFHVVHSAWGLQMKSAGTGSTVASLPPGKASTSLTAVDSDRVLLLLKTYQQSIITSINSGTKRIQNLRSQRAESFTNYVIGGTIGVLGGTSLPSNDWEDAWQPVNAAYLTLAKRQIKESLDLLNAASKATLRHWEQLNDYLEHTDQGAERSVTALKGIVVAAAAVELVLGGVVLVSAIGGSTPALGLAAALQVVTPAAEATAVVAPTAAAVAAPAAEAAVVAAPTVAAVVAPAAEAAVVAVPATVGTVSTVLELLKALSLAVTGSILVSSDSSKPKDPKDGGKKKKVNKPTGLTDKFDDAIPMIWYKDKSYYPSPIMLEGHYYERDIQTSLPRGEEIGIRSEYIPVTEKTLMLLPERRDPNRTRQFRRTLIDYGFDWGPYDVDHVLDIQWGGHDGPDNFWPMESQPNQEAGPLQNQRQIVTYYPSYEAPQPLSVSIQTGRDLPPSQRLLGRYFRIRLITTL